MSNQPEPTPREKWNDDDVVGEAQGDKDGMAHSDIYFYELSPKIQSLLRGQAERDYTPEEALIEANKRWGGKNAVSVECYLSQWDDIDYDKIPKVGKKYKVSGIYKNQEFEGSSFREAFANADKAEAEREKK